MSADLPLPSDRRNITTPEIRTAGHPDRTPDRADQKASLLDRLSDDPPDQAAETPIPRPHRPDDRRTTPSDTPEPPPEPEHTAYQPDRPKRSTDSETETQPEAPDHPKISEKAFTHILDGEWNKRGDPVGFHHAPNGIPPENRRITWTGNKTPEGIYPARVEFRNEKTGEWHPKTVPEHTMFPDHWPREKVSATVQEAYKKIYDEQIGPALEKGRNLRRIELQTRIEGILIRIYTDPSGSLKTAFPVVEEKKSRQNS